MSIPRRKKHRQLISALKKNISKAEKQIEAGDITKFIEIDTEFHDIIADLAGSEHLKELTKNIRLYVIYFRYHSVHQIANVELILAGHKAIIETAEKGDVKGAQNAFKNHIYQSKEDNKRYQKTREEGKSI